MTGMRPIVALSTGAFSFEAWPQIVNEAAVASYGSAGKVTAPDVAQKVFDAIAANQFYIYSHPKALEAVAQRMQAIVSVNNPPDPFAARPEIGIQLRADLRQDRV